MAARGGSARALIQWTCEARSPAASFEIAVRYALGAASTIFFDPRYTGGVMLAAILVAIVVTLIPLLRRREESYDGLYDEK